MKLEGRVVLVTGGARRVGRAIALRLARAGCRLAVHYHRSADDALATAEQCRRIGAEAEVFQANFEDVTQAEELVPAVLSRFGRLDVLINNASVFERMDMTEFTLDRWERVMRVNLTVPMLLVSAAREALLESCGRVVNLCDAALGRPWPDHLAYMVSKGGLETLTKVLAKALAPDVNVVGIAPGVVAWPPEYEREIRDRLTAKIPLERAGEPEDVAAAVHFVLSEGDYLTGVILPVDGGRSVT